MKEIICQLCINTMQEQYCIFPHRGCTSCIFYDWQQRHSARWITGIPIIHDLTYLSEILSTWCFNSAFEKENPPSCQAAFLLYEGSTYRCIFHLWLHYASSCHSDRTVEPTTSWRNFQAFWRHRSSFKAYCVHRRIFSQQPFPLCITRRWGGVHTGSRCSSLGYLVQWCHSGVVESCL